MSTDRSSSEHLAAEMAAFPEMNPAPVIRTDTEGRILLANEAARSALGKERLEGLSWLEFAPGITAGFWAVVTRGGSRPALESSIGDRTYSFTYRLSPDGKSVFIFGADVTEFRRAEERIEQYSARMAEMARFPDMNPGPVLRTDRDGRILLANSAALELFGQDSLLGRIWLDVCPGMNDVLWSSLLGRSDVVRHEANVRQRAFVFAHRVSDDEQLVFIYGNDVTVLRAAEEALRRAEKMATLGTLSAGVAHELNNPAAAATRGSEQLRDALVLLEEAFVPMSQLCHEPNRMDQLHELVLQLRDRAERRVTIDAVARSDRESRVEEWLDERGVPDAWEVAPAIVNLGYSDAELASLESTWGRDIATVAKWMARSQPVYTLVKEIREASSRISEIVKALKTYSFLGQAPVRPVDIAEGLESTLVMLRSKLKGGISVTRDFDSSVPPVEGFGSELNQVWTNLIDNAVDAMNGRGTLTLSVRREGDAVSVGIEDSGPGIPDDVVGRIFDPFFTTKAVGSGTGLGLATAQSIVEKRHHGTIRVTSRPGCTRFTVLLPVRQPEGAEPGERSLLDPTAEYPGVNVR